MLLSHGLIRGLFIMLTGTVALGSVVYAQEPASDNYRLRSYGFGSGGIEDSMSTSLIGYWKFDEGTGSLANDSSAHGNHGTLVNSPTWSTDTPDLVFSNPYSLDFDGTSRYVQVTDSDSLEPVEITMAAWVNARSWNTPVAFITKRTAGSNGYFWFVHTGEAVFFDWGGSGSGGRWNTGYVPPTNEWVHLVVTRDAGGRKLYVNGVLESSTTNAGGSVISSSADLHIARDSISNRYFVDGMMDDVRIYNRALTDTEIESLASGEHVGGYRLSGISGEVSGGNLEGNNFNLGSGLNYALQADVPLAPTIVNNSNYHNKLHLTIDPASNPVDAKFAVAISTDAFANETKYVKMDGTVGDSLAIEDYRTYAEWGGANGDYVIGLRANRLYTVKVKAMHGDFTETGYGPTDSAATVGSHMRFDIDVSPVDEKTNPPYLIDLGDLFGDVIVGSTEKVWVDFETNAEGGGRVYIAGNNEGLLSNTVTHTINSLTGDLSGVNEGFGVQGDSASELSGGPFTISSLYDVSGNLVGIADSTIREIFISDSPIFEGRASFVLKAKSSNVTPAANDYMEIINVIAAAMF